MFDKSHAHKMLENPEIARLGSNSNLFAELKQTKKQVDVDGETLYLVEGDLLLDEVQLEIYALQQEALHQAKLMGVGSSSASLMGIMQNGKLVRWPVGTVLSYAVLRQTFTPSQYDEIVNNMRQATQDWEETCGVKFEHRAQYDDSAPGAPVAQVIFVVRRVDNAPFIASAFFPNDPINRRRMLIDNSQYFNLPPPPAGFDRVGVLRHELGHVIGCRHEHIRSEAPAVCQGEALYDAVPLTAYDPQSVMHYFCGNRGSRDLKITTVDRTGAQKIYGPPLNTFDFAQV
jgi:hypothetical protein